MSDNEDYDMYSEGDETGSDVSDGDEGYLSGYLENLFKMEDPECRAKALKSIRRKFSNLDQVDWRMPPPPVHVHVLRNRCSRRELLRGLISLEEGDADRVQGVVEAAKGTGVVVGLGRLRLIEDGSGERLIDSDCEFDDEQEEEDGDEEEQDTRPHKRREERIYGKQRYRPNTFQMAENGETWRSFELLNLRIVSPRNTLPLPKPTTLASHRYLKVDEEVLCHGQDWEPWKTPDIVEFEEDQYGHLIEYYYRTCLVLYRAQDEVEISRRLCDVIGWALQELSSPSLSAGGSSVGPASSKKLQSSSRRSKALAMYILSWLSPNAKAAGSDSQDSDAGVGVDAIHEDEEQEPFEEDEPELGPDLESDEHTAEGDRAASTHDPVIVLLWYALNTSDAEVWKKTLALRFKTLDVQTVLDLLEYTINQKRLDLWNDVLGASFTGPGFLACKVASRDSDAEKVLSSALDVFGLEDVKDSLGLYMKKLRAKPEHQVAFIQALKAASATKPLTEDVNTWSEHHCEAELIAYGEHGAYDTEDAVPLMQLAKWTQNDINALEPILTLNDRLKFDFVTTLIQALLRSGTSSSTTSQLLDSIIIQALKLVVPLWDTEDEISELYPSRLDRFLAIVELSVQAVALSTSLAQTQSQPGSSTTNPTAPLMEPCRKMFASVLSDAFKNHEAGDRAALYDEFNTFYLPLIPRLRDVLKEATTNEGSDEMEAMAKTPFREFIAGLVRIYTKVFFGTQDAAYLHPLLEAAGCGSITVAPRQERSRYRPKKGTCPECKQLDAFLLSSSTPDGESIDDLRIKANKDVRGHVEAQLSSPLTRTDEVVEWSTMKPASTGSHILAIRKKQEMRELESWEGRVNKGWEFLETVFGDRQVVGGAGNGAGEHPCAWEARAKKVLGEKEWESIRGLLHGVQSREEDTPKRPMTLGEARAARKRTGEGMRDQENDKLRGEAEAEADVRGQRVKKRQRTE
ncbi:hypothetical protein BKA70DRAFT_217425 [Coprinopsis sp. MPI-PUGE-AT-0042]|nr:hypothetical protein BKA70DRAFT_217425 [Coprinopsis sp. MPI-PUGE-AT-0042]